jgi:hypothetical protein
MTCRRSFPGRAMKRVHCDDELIDYSLSNDGVEMDYTASMANTDLPWGQSLIISDDRSSMSS